MHRQNPALIKNHRWIWLIMIHQIRSNKEDGGWRTNRPKSPFKRRNTSDYLSNEIITPPQNFRQSRRPKIALTKISSAKSYISQHSKFKQIRIKVNYVKIESLQSSTLNRSIEEGDMNEFSDGSQGGYLRVNRCYWLPNSAALKSLSEYMNMFKIGTPDLFIFDCIAFEFIHFCYLVFLLD